MEEDRLFAFYATLLEQSLLKENTFSLLRCCEDLDFYEDLYGYLLILSAEKEDLELLEKTIAYGERQNLTITDSALFELLKSEKTLLSRILKSALNLRCSASWENVYFKSRFQKRVQKVSPEITILLFQKMRATCYTNYEQMFEEDV